MSPDELLAAAAAVDAALRPSGVRRATKDNPLHPRPARRVSAAVAVAPARAKPLRSRAPAASRDMSLALGVEVEGGAIVVALPPRGGSTTPAQQAAAQEAAANVLAMATKVASGATIHITRRGRVIASTNAEAVVSVAPPAKPIPAAPVPAPTKPAPGKPSPAKHPS